jgi:hypothetical protein
VRRCCAAFNYGDTEYDIQELNGCTFIFIRIP